MRDRLSRALAAARGAGRDFLADVHGIAAIEAAFIMPVGILLLALVVFGGEGLGIQRKVTLATRTVADLVAQTDLSSNVNSNSTASINQSTLDYYLSLSALVVYPYDSSVLQATVSEVQVTCGSTTGTVEWSEPYNGGTALTQNSTVTLPLDVVESVTSSSGCSSPPANAYLILSQLQYTYKPLNMSSILGTVGGVTIVGSLYMTLRSVSQIDVNWGS